VVAVCATDQRRAQGVGMSARSIQLNGAARETTAATLVQLLEQLDLRETMAGVAVAVNGTVVPRGQWPVRKLQDGDCVELIGAVQGG
jgi:sulfur carrier protein